MENKDKIRNLVENKFSVTRIADDLNQGFIHIKIKKDGVQGIGSSLSVGVAIDKAYHEYCERKILRSINLPNSNGMAAHFNQKLSAESSTSELIERDVFLTSWLSETGPYWLTDLQRDIYSKLSTSFLKQIRKLNIGFRIGVAGVCNDRHVTIGVLTDEGFRKPFGMILATASGKDIGQAIDKITMDLNRTLSVYIQDSSECSLKDPIALTKPINHLQYYLNPESLDGLDWFFEGNSQILKLKDIEIQVEELRSFEKYPLWDPVVSVAKSNNAQEYFTGLSIDHINLDRFYENQLSPIGLKHVHPLG